MTDNHAVPPMDHAEFDQSSTTAGATDPLGRFVEHQRRAIDEMGKALDALVPPGFKEHSAEAGREFVKGMKVLVDAAITELEKASKEVERRRETAADDDRPTTTGTTKVKVQVE